MKSFYEKYEEIIDQAAHLFFGALISVVVCFLTDNFMGVVATMVFAFIRELSQHDWKRVNPKDLMFWFVGSLMGAAINLRPY